MKPNSPSWARLNPVWTALFRPFPAVSTPSVTKIMSEIRTTRVMTSMVPQCSAITCGATIIPTETKKIAPNISLIGVTSFSIRSDSTVSASIDPITNAPSAEENPTPSAKATMARQSPMLTMSRTSSLMYFFAFLRRVGMRYIPTRNQSMRKKASFARLYSISPPANLFDTASDDRRTMSRIAIMSSIMMVPNTIGA